MVVRPFCCIIELKSIIFAYQMYNYESKIIFSHVFLVSLFNGEGTG